MTVIVYKCNTCKRTIDIPQNKYGLDVIQRCIITQGCRGKLHLEDVKQDFIRGSYPTEVAGVTDWAPRRVLYDHTQTIKSKQWQINHNLGVKPVVQVFVHPNDNSSELVEVTPESITILNLNELLINFSTPHSGTAQCIARSTANITNQLELVPEPTTTTVQVTSTFELTLATRNEDVILPVTLEFLSDNNSYIVTYNVDDNPSINSPWSKVNKIFVKNKTYIVRSFKINDNLFNPHFANGNIRNGATVRFTLINGSAITNEQALLLLASFPYETHDIILNKFIDVTNINPALPELYYNTGELYISDLVISTTFPFIKAV